MRPISKRLNLNRHSTPVVTLGRVAAALGVSRATAYTMARAGELPVRWTGDRYEMEAADLERLVAEHSPSDGAAA